MHVREPMTDLFTSSKLLVLDFAYIPENTPPEENMQAYFTRLHAAGSDPKLAENRQAFNETVLVRSSKRYLVSRYAEDRKAMLAGSHIAKEGRTFHLGVDIFAASLEPVFAPCNGLIVRSGRELEDHSFGYYTILQPQDVDLPYIFFGHLAPNLAMPGTVVSAGEQIATLGDFVGGENGGWSRHLHLQLLRELPPEDEAPLGYSTRVDLTENQQRYPDPLSLFTNWRIDH